MNAYRTLDRQTISLARLNPLERELLNELTRQVLTNIQTMTRHKLELYYENFTLDALSDIEIEPSEDAYSLVEHLKDGIFLTIISDLAERIGIAAGIVPTKGIKARYAKAKEWTGEEEDPVYVFHIRKDTVDQKSRLLFGSTLIHTYDRPGGQHTHQMEETFASNRDSMIGMFVLPGDKIGAFIAQLQKDYGHEIDELLQQIFKESCEFGVQHASDGIMDTTDLRGELYQLPLVRGLLRDVGHDITSIIDETINIGVHAGFSGSHKGFI